jgi:hypothetical protein
VVFFFIPEQFRRKFRVTKSKGICFKKTPPFKKENHQNHLKFIFGGVEIFCHQFQYAFWFW